MAGTLTWDPSAPSGSRVVRADGANPRPEAVRGAQFRGDPQVPLAVEEGEIINISGGVTFDCVTCIQKRAIRVELMVQNQASGRSIEETVDVGRLGHSEEGVFNFNVPTPGDEGDTLLVTLTALWNDPIFGWTSGDTFGPAQMEVLSAGEKQQNQIVRAITEWGPWVAGGAGAGIVLSQVDQDVDIIPATAGGALGGIGSKAIADEVMGVNLEFPLVPVAVTTVGLFGAGWLLSNINELAGN